MEKVKLTNDEIKSQLDRQLNLLKHHVEDFINTPDLALDIATKIRVLCHDTNHRQTSLLTNLGLKETLYFPNTFFLESSNNTNAPLCGLVYIELNFQNARFLPKYEKGLERATSKTFEQWWNTVIVRDYKGNTLTRKELVLEVAETDGGAHVDESLKGKYHFISRKHSLTWQYYQKDKPGVPLVGIELASICQIGFELIKALEPKYNIPQIDTSNSMLGEFSVNGYPSMAMFGKLLPFRMEISVPVPKGKVRNQPCGCGSGLKSKKCCPMGSRVYVTTDPVC